MKAGVLGGLLPARERRLFDRATAPVYGVIAAMLAVIVAATSLGSFDCDVAFARDTGLALLLFLVVAWLARWLGFPMIGSPIEAMILVLTSAFLAPWCAVILASANMPLADAGLAHADSLLFGFDRTRFVAPFNAIPWVRRAFIWVYNSFTAQPFLLLLLLFASRRAARAWLFLTAWGLALAIALVISPFVPAFGTPPYVLEFVDVLRGARDGSVRMLDGATLTGIITFPSFHAAGAMLFAWGFSCFGRAAAPMLALNAAMVVSAVIVGGHYLIDLPAGILVAVVAIALARRIHRWWEVCAGGLAAQPSPHAFTAPSISQ